jgi:hypothetical protein
LKAVQQTMIGLAPQDLELLDQLVSLTAQSSFSDKRGLHLG